MSQVQTEISVLREFLKLIRETNTIGNKKWTKVVGIGHSYGAAHTEAVSASDPDLYDAVILQGFSANASHLSNYLQAGAYSIARNTLPDHLGDKPPAWLVTGSAAAAQIPSYYYPFYAPGAFDLARKTEQPVTPGSLFTVAVAARTAVGFTKPVQVVFGDKDFVFAGGDAYAGDSGSSIPAELQSILYPNVSLRDFEVFIPANTGAWYFSMC